VRNGQFFFKKLLAKILIIVTMFVSFLLFTIASRVKNIVAISYLSANNFQTKN
jgi:hypothetical protein